MWTGGILHAAWPRRYNPLRPVHARDALDTSRLDTSNIACAQLALGFATTQRGKSLVAVAVSCCPIYRNGHLGQKVADTWPSLLSSRHNSVQLVCPRRASCGGGSPSDQSSCLCIDSSTRGDACSFASDAAEMSSTSFVAACPTSSSVRSPALSSASTICVSIGSSRKGCAPFSSKRHISPLNTSRAPHSSAFAATSFTSALVMPNSLASSGSRSSISSTSSYPASYSTCVNFA
mmetsp:Transcript_8784/g.23212  ORF Transcript_8784/g.23212 Transcript_8784/m.23212 type:complete len:234 (-) Transcript_8784:351-1052(-)